MAQIQHRYLTLDAARGFAAIAVVIVHIQPSLMPGRALPSGYLAVDFFFALSGFVLAHAYQDRLGVSIGSLEFLRLRLIRLYPLFFLAGIVSLTISVVKLFLGKVSVIYLGGMLANLFFIPVPAFHLYPLNFPSWSLAFELIVNVAFVMFSLRLRASKLLIIVIFCFWISLIAVAAALGSIDGGPHPQDWWGGLSRVGFSFFTGVALYRLQQSKSFSLPPWTAIPLLAVLVVTFMFDGNAAYDLFVVTIVYPAILFLGAKITTPAPTVSAYLGDISYAIYVLHIPIRTIMENVLNKLQIKPSLMIGISFVVAMLILAAVADRTFDRPVRRWLGSITRNLRPRKCIRKLH